MMVQSKSIFNKGVADAVSKGLGSQPKTLPSWLFYDETGNKIFQQIMHMHEYYPTRCEYDILQQYKDDLLKHFTNKARSFRLIELGAGDGLKTEILLKHFVAHHAGFTYMPVDISPTALELLADRLTKALPGLRTQPLNKTYDDALISLRDDHERKVILFMGANIGNFTVSEATLFLEKMALALGENDLLLLGFDLKKDPRIIQEAYDDPRGITKSFNLNILSRLNRELGAAFNVPDFTHYPFYDPETGTTKSFLVSMKQQTVFIEALGRPFHFGLWETIQTETSQKYDLPMIEKLLAPAGLKITEVFYDSQRYFCDVLVKAD